MAEVKTEENEVEKYELFYWKLRNRGNWIRYMFEEAKVPFVDHSVSYNGDDFYAFIKGSFRAFGDGKANPMNDSNPAFAPPAIKRGELFLCQSEVIVNYLAQELDLLPVNEDKAVQRLQYVQCQQILANCNDIIREVYGQRGKEKKDLFSFFEGGRFAKWLNLIEIPLKNAKDSEEGNIYYFNGKMCYIDLIVFNVVEGLNDLLGKKFDAYFKDYTLLLKHFEGVGKRECVAALLKKQKQELKFKWFVGKAFNKIAEEMGFV